MVIRWWLLRLLAVLLLVGAVFAPTSAGAQQDNWRTYLSSAKQAFVAGRYGDAMRLLESAHRLSKEDALLYNLGKAAHFKYIEGKLDEDLQHAVRSYRAYLDKVPNGARRVEATKALSELEPQLPSTDPPAEDPDDPYAELDPPPATPKPAAPPPRRTGIVVTTSAPDATIIIDDGMRGESPLIVATTPGMHAVRVEAPGYVTAERRVRVDAGVERALDITLEVIPARIHVSGPAGAGVYLNGKHMGDLPLPARLAVAPGHYFLSVTKNGHTAHTEPLMLNRAAVVDVDADLDTTGQRYSSFGAFALGGAGLVVAAVLGVAAADQQETAQNLQDQRQQAGGLTVAGADEFDEAVSQRDDLRTAAFTTMGLSAAVLTTGLFLFLFDEPLVQAPALGGDQPDDSPKDPKGPELELGAAPWVGPEGGGATVRLRF